MKQSMLLVLDMQAAILSKQVYEKESLIDNVNSLINVFSRESLPIALSRHTNNTSLTFRSDGWEIDHSIAIPQNATLFDKKRSNIFMESDFAGLLRQKDILHLWICGLVSNGCVQAACVEATGQGYDVTLPSDGHSTFVKDAAAVIAMWNGKLSKLGVQTVPTKEILRQF